MGHKKKKEKVEKHCSHLSEKLCLWVTCSIATCADLLIIIGHPSTIALFQPCKISIKEIYKENNKVISTFKVYTRNTNIHKHLLNCVLKKIHRVKDKTKK